MLISLDKKFIYLHYPKTGGCTIQSTLRPYSYVTNSKLIANKKPWDLVINTTGCTLQSTLRPYSYVTNSELISKGSKDQKFWSSVGAAAIPKHSSYNSSLCKKLMDKYNDFLVLGSVRNPWDLVISTIKFRPDLYKSTSKKVIMNYGNSPIFQLYKLMSEFYGLKNNSNIKIIKMESLEEDLKNILHPLGVEIVLKNDNINRVNDDYRKYYDNESKEYIGKLFKKDIKNFNYKF